MISSAEFSQMNCIFFIKEYLAQEFKQDSKNLMQILFHKNVLAKANVKSVKSMINIIYLDLQNVNISASANGGPPSRVCPR